MLSNQRTLGKFTSRQRDIIITYKVINSSYFILVYVIIKKINFKKCFKYIMIGFTPEASGGAACWIVSKD